MNEDVSVIKNYIYNLCYQILLLLLPFVTTPYVSRVLGVTNIGIYSYTSSIVAYFSLFSLLSTHIYGQREVARCRNDRKKISVIFFEVQLIKFVATYLTLVVFLFVYSKIKYSKFLLIQIVILFSNFFDISWFYQGLEDFKTIISRNIIVKILGVIAVFLYVKTRNDLGIYIGINVWMSLVGNLVLWIQLKKLVVKVPTKSIHAIKNLKAILELFVPMIAVQVYNVMDKTMIGIIYSNVEENGYYEQTVKIINIALVIITSISTVLYPRMSAEFAKKNIEEIKKKFSAGLQNVFFLACPLCVGLFVISDNMVPWFLGEGFGKVATLLKIYTLVLLIVPLSNLAGYVILTPSGQHNKGTVAVTIGAVTNFLLNTFLIRRMGAIGAAIATIIAECIVSGLHLYFSRHYFSIKKTIISFMRYLSGAIVMGLVVEIVTFFAQKKDFGNIIITLLQCLVGFIIYFVYLIVFLKDKVIIGFLKKIRVREVKK